MRYIHMETYGSEGAFRNVINSAQSLTLCENRMKKFFFLQTLSSARNFALNSLFIVR